MFKNPIKKYQSGGKATPQQQQQIAQLFEAASKNTGIDVETLMNAANELKDENSMKQYVEAISLAAQGDKTAIDSIKKMFGQQPAMRKLGGKIRDFICKHANGKKIADCGCKEDGGKVEKHQQNNGKGRGTIAEQDGFSVGKKYWTNNADGSTQSDQYAVRPNGIAVRQRIVDRSHMLDRDQLPVRDTVNVTGFMQDNGVFAPDYDAEIIYGAHPYFQNNAWSTVRREEEGGVVKGQNSIPDGMPEPPQVGIVYRKKYKPIGENQATYEDGEYVTTKNEPLLGKRYTGWRRQVEPGTTKLAYSDMFGGMPDGMTHRFTRINNGDNILDVIIPYNTNTDANELNTVQRLINGQDTTYFPDRAKFIDLLRSKRTFANGRPNWIVLDNERNKVNKK